VELFFFVWRYWTDGTTRIGGSIRPLYQYAQYKGLKDPIVPRLPMRGAP